MIILTAFSLKVFKLHFTGKMYIKQLLILKDIFQMAQTVCEQGPI